MTPSDSANGGPSPGAGVPPPTEASQPAPSPNTQSPAVLEYHWYHKVGAVLFILFCLEIGGFLAVFPWTEYWEANYLSSLIPRLQPYWDNPYVRGAVSGLGIVNLYIALSETFGLRRFARK